LLVRDIKLTVAILKSITNSSNAIISLTKEMVRNGKVGQLQFLERILKKFSRNAQLVPLHFIHNLLSHENVVLLFLYRREQELPGNCSVQVKILVAIDEQHALNSYHRVPALLFSCY
jgi:hypothetical protein